MKILLVNNVGTLHGGAETMVRLLRDHLQSQGHEVLVLAGSHKGNGGWFADRSFLTFADGSLAQGLLYIFNPFAMWRLWRTLRNFKPDIVHLHNISMASPFILPLLKDYPTLFTIHDHTVFDPTRLAAVPSLLPYKSALAGYFFDERSLRFYGERLRFWFYKRFYKHIRVALACSEFFKRCAQESGLFHTIKVVPNGVELPAPQPPVSSDELVYVGRLSAEKGVEVLVQAMPQIIARCPQAHLTLVGDGDLRARLQAQATQLGIGQAVTFAGHQSSEQTRRAYGQAKIVVVPSVYPENFGLVCVEAMATGRPVVASRVGGIPEIVADGQTGLLVTPGSAEALAKALILLLGDTQAQAAMAKAGRRRAQNLFSAQVYTNATLAAYKKLLGGGAA